MPQPEFYPEGVTPVRGETRLRTWMKILGAYQNQSGALLANNPRAGDTLRQVRVKINKALTGTT